MELLLGVLAAAIASSLFNGGIAVQALDARDAPLDAHLRPSLLVRLARRPRWLAGTALTVLGWPFQVGAFALAPVALVQPALAVGVLVLLVAGKRLLHEPIERRDVLAVAGILAGVAGLALVVPGQHDAQAHGAALALALGGLAAASAVPYVLALARAELAEVTMLAAGLGYSGGAIASALVERALSGGHLVHAALWGGATLAFDAVAMLSEMSALGRRPAVQVAPAVLVVQTVVPVALAPLVFHERLPGGVDGAILVACLALVVVAGAALVRSPALLAFAGDGSGTPRSPDTPSAETTCESAGAPAAAGPTLTTTTSPERSRP
jgi:drug/metabolite transporter (DMT)-like permease